jgi:hypothetical protein
LLTSAVDPSRQVATLLAPASSSPKDGTLPKEADSKVLERGQLRMDQTEGKFDKAKGSAHNVAGDVKDAALTKLIHDQAGRLEQICK